MRSARLRRRRSSRPRSRRGNLRRRERRRRSARRAIFGASGPPRAAGAPPTSSPRTTMAPTSSRNSFDTQRALATPAGEVWIHRLDLLGRELGVDLSRLPVTIRILLEAVLRNVDGVRVRGEDVERLARWSPRTKPE